MHILLKMHHSYQQNNQNSNIIEHNYFDKKYTAKLLF